MSRPPYITLMMLNPVGSAFVVFKEPGTKTDSIEEQPLVRQLANQSTADALPSSFVPKRSFSLFIWFLIIVLNFLSWFTFTAANPILRTYYQTELLHPSLIFLASPLILAIMTPLLYRALQKAIDPLFLLMLAAFSNAIGSGIKCKGTGPDGYFTLLIGQSFIYCSTAFSLAYPLAQRRESFNCLFFLGSMAASIGCSAGISIPVLLCSEVSSMPGIGWCIYKIFICSAVISVSVLILIPFALKEKHQPIMTSYQSNIETAPPICDPTNVPVPVPDMKPIKTLLWLSLQDFSFVSRLLQIGLSYATVIALFISCSSVYQTEMLKLVSYVQVSIALLFFVIAWLSFKYRIHYSKWSCLIISVFLTTFLILLACYKDKATGPVRVSLLEVLHLSACALTVASITNLKSVTSMLAFETICVTNIAIQILGVLLSLSATILLWKFGLITWIACLASWQFGVFCLAFSNRP